jgi:hypothetical protein
MNLVELRDKLKKRTILPEEFLVELWKISTGHTRNGHVFASEKLTLYRTRAFKEKTTPEYISDLSYPPLEKCKLNRANDGSEQVFYGSAGLPTTLRESRVNAGEYIIVSKWTNSEIVMLQPVGLSNSNNELEKLYNDIFTDTDESIYAYSSRIAKHLMTGVPSFGLLYPSIINGNKSHNVALNKDIVDKRIKFVNAILYRVDDITSDSSFQVTELNFATSNFKMLDWKGRKKQWTVPANSEVRAVSNGWDWDIRLIDGTPLEPH